MKNFILIILFGIISNFSFSQITLSVTSTPVSCFGGSNGSATVTASGGSGPYSYTWQPTGTNGNIITGLHPGQYQIYVQDQAANTASAVVNIGQPQALQSTVTTTFATCNGACNGRANAVINGGTPPYTYSWAPSGMNIPEITGLCAGAYTLTTTDINGCTLTSPAFVNQPAALNVAMSATNSTCNQANGNICATVTGGITPYNSYVWSNGITTLCNSNNFAGAYTFTVVDVNGCIATASGFINDIAGPALSVISLTNATCYGLCNGGAATSITGGTPPYTYLWTPSGMTTPEVTGLCAGTNNLIATDANGCTATSTAVITQPPQMNISISQTNTTCDNNCNGSASASITGGTGPFYYQWLPSGETTANINNLCVGHYSVTVGDAMGCVNTNTFMIVPTGTISNLSGTLTPMNETCFLSGDGSINLNLSGTNPGPFIYEWSNGATSQNIYNTTWGHYWVKVMDPDSGCLVLQTNVNYIGTNCGSISGNTFIDINSDCIKNTGDFDLTTATIIMNPGSRYAIPDHNGNYAFGNVPFGTYQISTVSYPASLTPTCITTLTMTISAGNPSSSNNNLAFNSISPNQPDMFAYAYSNGIVPGFLCHVNYNLINQAYYNGSGIFKAQLPSSMIANFSSASPNTYTITGDTIMWDFSNIAYNTSNYFTVNFTVPVNTPLGSTFNTCWWIQTSTPDFYPQNNTGCYQRLVTGSFDPNDKSVSPVGVGANGSILASETDLTYLIRFQNTGNGPAHFIVVRDTLSPNLDVASLKMLSASHNYNLEILPGNILKWRFDNIMLPDSGSNEAGSHGYIQYAIKRNGNNNPGTEIKNTAYIYFDFNEPVITNTTLNTIMAPTFVSSSNKNDNSWLVYPNPNNGILYISNSTSENKEIEIQITNAIGDVVYQGITSQQTKTLDLNKHSNGVYFIKLTSDKQTSIQRIVLSK